MTGWVRNRALITHRKGHCVCGVVNGGVKSNMTRTVTKITEASILRPREHLVSHLENLLSNARTGELTGIVAVGVWQGQNVSHGWSLPNGCHLRTIMGEMDILKHRLIDNELNNG